MMSYKVIAKVFGEWEATDIHLNKMAAECIRDYYIEHGHEAYIEKEK